MHGLLGGEVEHDSTAEDNLDDYSKMMHRLAALNLMAAEGWAPNIAFWQVRRPTTGLLACQWAC